MNDSRFGLTASIWTADVDAAWPSATESRPGLVLNSCDYLDPALAWTGVKHSGRGSRCHARLLERDPAQVVPPETGAVTIIGVLHGDMRTGPV